MNKKIFAVCVIVIVASVGVYFFIRKSSGDQQTNNLSSTTQVTESLANWKTYENAVYHYSIKHPLTWVAAQVQEEERGTVEESASIIIEHAGGGGVVGIMAWDPSMLDKANNSATIAFKKTLFVDLRSFAETARQKELYDKNPNFPNKEVSDLQEMSFAGQKAFSYAVTNSTDSYGSSNDRYLFLEENSIKYKVYYSLDFNLPQEIANTFRFIDPATSTPVTSN